MTVGDLPVAAPLLVATAALEVTVHGWDVAQATGRDTPVPPRLARDLLPVAHLVVSAEDRGVRFAAALPATGTAYDARLLAFLGRDLTGPPPTDSRQSGHGTGRHFLACAPCTGPRQSSAPSATSPRPCSAGTRSPARA